MPERSFRPIDFSNDPALLLIQPNACKVVPLEPPPPDFRIQVMSFLRDRFRSRGHNPVGLEEIRTRFGVDVDWDWVRSELIEPGLVQAAETQLLWVTKEGSYELALSAAEAEQG